MSIAGDCTQLKEIKFALPPSANSCSDIIADVKLHQQCCRQSSMKRLFDDRKVHAVDRAMSTGGKENVFHQSNRNC